MRCVRSDNNDMASDDIFNRRGGMDALDSIAGDDDHWFIFLGVRSNLEFGTGVSWERDFELGTTCPCQAWHLAGLCREIN